MSNLTDLKNCSCGAIVTIIDAECTHRCGAVVISCKDCHKYLDWHYPKLFESDERFYRDDAMGKLAREWNCAN